MLPCCRAWSLRSSDIFDARSRSKAPFLALVRLARRRVHSTWRRGACLLSSIFQQGREVGGRERGRSSSSVASSSANLPAAANAAGLGEVQRPILSFFIVTRLLSSLFALRNLHPPFHHIILPVVAVVFAQLDVDAVDKPSYCSFGLSFPFLGYPSSWTTSRLHSAILA